jgi:hypothetical protein
MGRKFGKLILFIFGIIFSAGAFSQLPDSDGDGVNDSNDACPFVKGTKGNKGCPEENIPVACNYITAASFDAVLLAVCNNTAHRQVRAKLDNNKNLLTGFTKNGIAQNFPVFYKQTDPNNYSVSIGLSNRLSDTTAILNCINRLFRESSVCNGLYKQVQLTYTPASQKYADVYATDESGVFFYLEKVKSGSKSLVQLRISKLIYKKETEKPAVKNPPSAPANECNDFEQILTECISAYTKVKGSFVKEEVPAKYYTTTLPGLGLAEKYVVESVNVEISSGKVDRRNVIYYSAEKEFGKTDEALLVYEQLKNRLKKCYSGTVNITDDKNQKIYEFFTDYKGKSIRITLIYLNFFSSSVSVSVKLAD